MRALKFARKYWLVGVISLLPLFSLGDILVDIGEGENAIHIASESFFLFILTGACCYFGWRVALSIATGSPCKSDRIFMPLFLCLMTIFCLATADDVSSMITSAAETSGYVSAISFSNNLHEVVPGKFYRSGEMSPHRFQEVLQENGIKTVIDLRLGDDDPDPSGHREADYTTALKVNYRHIRFHSSTIPRLDEMNALLQVYKTAALPILVHCSSGTHRSGFAAAVWILEQNGGTREEALDQLSPRYGFFRFERRLQSFFKGHPTLDTLIWRYTKEAPSSQSFSTWIQQALGKDPSLERNLSLAP